MKKLLAQIAAATLGLWLTTMFISGVVVTVYSNSSFFGISLTDQWQMFLALGIILGLLNYFVGPALKALALPLEIITLGLFSLVINMGIIWFLDLIFDELTVPLILPLVYTTLIIWGLNLVITIVLKRKD